ncbi:unnamed protein product [Ilex paraguariensis]|uniref:Flavin-containing monooxygenase n=1 Tax=Ilex paraguariensis TaxID=185542 RepID=A0ABC8RTX3_9AQUA
MVSVIYQSKNVCVIGAGPSGLVAARELRKEGHNVVVLEQNHDFGGQWLYDPNVEGEDPLGKGTTLKVHSSLYESIRLVSPREIMGYSDFPFLVKKGRDMRRFPSHRELFLYLKDFCEWFGLKEMLRFNVRVDYVGMWENSKFGEDLKWVVRSKEKKSEKVVEEIFDAVIVATGHYSQPRLPDIQGPSGLVAARELRKEGHNVVVLEQNHDFGGQWLYDPNVEGEDPLGKGTTLKVHSSLYESIRLVSPREIMGYSDFPFLVKKGRDMRRFPSHRELFLYLKDFCEWFGLKEMLRFNVRVDYVGMWENSKFGEDLKWVVRSKEKKSEKVVEEIFDAVIVATGHYSQPRLPDIQGMNTWRRKQMHSHIYRIPEPFRNEVVIVIGNSMSGQDIAIELVDVAKEIHLSAKSLDISEGLSKVISKYDNLHLHPLVESLQEDGRVIFIDGSCITADTIIYCTG